jgi:hypothetical protein
MRSNEGTGREMGNAQHREHVMNIKSLAAVVHTEHHAPASVFHSDSPRISSLLSPPVRFLISFP